jgi:L-lactate utilization protein LutB
MVDPFTNVTGTEMAMIILRSGRCNSNVPLEIGIHNMLDKIKSLISIRNFYPAHLKNM